MGNQVTEVRLLEYVPLENDYKHSLFFDRTDTQAQYFIGKTKYYGSDRSFQRKNGYIDWNLHIDELDTVNYVMYRNNPLSRWTYAFITEKEYKNDSLTRLHIETDVIQSYLLDYTVKPSFVEREHCDDDTIGKHTYPENLETGEFECVYHQKIEELSNCYYILGVTEIFDEEGNFTKVAGREYDGIYSGIRYIAFDPVSELETIDDWINHYAQAGKTDAITCLFMYPKHFINRITPGFNVSSKTSPHYIIREISIKDYESYIPKNNKLYVYPYRHLLVSNNNGASGVYKIEDFEDLIVKVKVDCCITPGGSIRMYPYNYRKFLSAYDDGINLGKYPICNWTSDVYTNWLTQNSVNIGLNIASGVGQIIAGGVMAAGTGGVGVAVGGSQIAGGVSTIANQLAQIHTMSFTPPQARGNTNCGDVITASSQNTFHFMQMKIKDEYMKIIDEFFSMFGYKTNRVKVPFSNHRENYWYTKTIDVSIDGAINNKDMQTIKNCYNNGITFWKDPSVIGDYSVSNEII